MGIPARPPVVFKRIRFGDQASCNAALFVNLGHGIGHSRDREFAWSTGQEISFVASLPAMFALPSASGCDPLQARSRHPVFAAAFGSAKQPLGNRCGAAEVDGGTGGDGQLHESLWITHCVRMRPDGQRILVLGGNHSR